MLQYLIYIVNMFKLKNIFFLLILFSINTTVSGQININEIEKQFGIGETTLKKRIKIAFIYNEASQSYHAKVSYRLDKLYIKNNENLNENHSPKGLIQIPFNEFQDLKLQRARYFKLDSIGNKILIENVKVKYADVKDYFIKNIFYADLKVKQFNCSVDLPENYFVSYSYDVIYKDLKFLSSFYFQNQNEAVKDVKISVKKNSNIDLAFFDFNLQNLDKSEDETFIMYTGENLKRYNSISNAVNGSYYLPHVIVSVKSIRKNKNTETILNSATDLYNWYNVLISELSKDKSYTKTLANSIIGSSTNKEEKIERLFKWVQNNIQYIAFENGLAGFKPAEANEVAKLKYGDCKGIANLLVNLLRAEGFDAHHAWIGTRSNNYSYDIPSLVVDNHMICGLNFNNKTYYLDGTSKSATWYTAPAHLEGKEVMLANGDTFRIETIKPSNPQDNQLVFNGVLDLNKPQPQITLDIELTGHFKHDFISHQTYSSLKNKKNIPFYFLYNYLDGIKVTNISEPIITQEKITYTVTGDYLNSAKSSSGVTVFPFLTIFEYENITNHTPPIYIDYPKVISTNIKVENNGKSPIEHYEARRIGNDGLSATYESKPNNSDTYISQKIIFNLFYSSLDKQEEWNSFYNEVNAFNTYPLSYE